MSTTQGSRGGPIELTVAQPRRIGALVVGGFFLCTAGVHVGIVMADPHFYASFGDAALVGFVRTGWSDVFMAHPAAWGLAVAAGEATLGALLLVGGRAARVGWVGVLTFTALLMLFGYGFWLWSLPALAVLGWLAARDWGLDGTNRR
jgi:hypothetical protein